MIFRFGIKSRRELGEVDADAAQSVYVLSKNTRVFCLDTQPGYGADVALEANEDKRIVRQNLAAAAEDLGIALDFRPIKDKTRIHFRVITVEEKAARPRRGGGRPRKKPIVNVNGTEQAGKPQKRSARTAQ